LKIVIFNTNALQELLLCHSSTFYLCVLSCLVAYCQIFFMQIQGGPKKTQVFLEVCNSRMC